MEFIVSKIEAAVEQLDWSIRLFLDQRAFIPAITLAGAAEELIGRSVGEQAAFLLLMRKLSQQYDLPERIVSHAHLNKAKNWLKHWDNQKDSATLTIELENEAVQYIVRALANLVEHDNSLPSEGPRFLEWLRRNRSDLMPCVP